MSYVAKLSQPLTGLTRIACAQPCIVDDGRLLRSGAIWNVSVGGLYLVVKAIPEVGNHLSVSFLLPGEIDMVKAAATVAWRNPPSLWPSCGESAAGLPPGCGLQFLTLSPADRSRIQARVARTLSRVPVPVS